MLACEFLNNGGIYRTCENTWCNGENILFCDKEVQFGSYKFNKTAYATGEICKSMTTPTVIAIVWNDGVMDLIKREYKVR